MTRLLFAALVGGTILCPPAWASTVVIWPVDPVIPADRPAAALWLENRGTETVFLQVRCLGWEQRTGEDELLPQEEVVASPPLARVEPGGRQMVRLVRRGPSGAAPEKAMRILVDELPVPAASGAAGEPGARLSVRMRYSIPLFTLAGSPGAPRLSWRLIGKDAARWLEITNAGTQHARLTDLRAEGAGRAVPLRPGLSGYVLAGATVRWSVPAGDAPSALKAGVNGADQPLPPMP